MRRFASRVAACFCLLVGRGAAAEGTPPNESVRPPQLVEFVPAEYPPAARAARREGAVTLRLTLDREGNVREAAVVGPATEFDAAAHEAVLRFRFAPAMRGGVPVTSRVLYRYAFTLPPDEPADTASTGVAAAAPHETSPHDVQPPVAPDAVPTAAPAAVRVNGPPAPPPEVVVHGRSEARRRRTSAEAVKVVELEEASRRTQDMGQVLARTEGVAVRRTGGLGSPAHFALNGLMDDQVRFFLDGVPLELAGYTFGISSVPVNLVERVEIYGGVVPARYGADALGGAVDLVTDRDLEGTRGFASYQAGSFHTQRATFGARHLDAERGVFTRIATFLDVTKNDYLVTVNVPDASGTPEPTRVRRFHDAYRAFGGSAEIGVVDRPWAQRLVLRGFATDYAKEYQNNIVMTVPYGGVTYGERSTGIVLKYRQPLLGGRVVVDATAGFSSTRSAFVDVSPCIYDWFGKCIGERDHPGETDTRPHDIHSTDQAWFARANLSVRLGAGHVVRAAFAPTSVVRVGHDERSLGVARDPLTTPRTLFTLVNGLEYEARLFDAALENILFVKDYVQSLEGDEAVTAGPVERKRRGTHRVGAGDALRYRLTHAVYAKASFEWATRLPSANEVFGDNAFIVSNLELVPETSKNVNLGLLVDELAAGSGTWRGAVTGFLRDADRLIVLLGTNQVERYENVLEARSLGVEAAVGWTSPGDYVVFGGNATYQDFRNTASDGTFGKFAGDRIPNRPYLFGNGFLRLALHDLATTPDELALRFETHYVHSFYRAWESVGRRDTKQVIPSQVVHTAGLTYRIGSDGARLTTALEVQNLTNTPVFDYFGVQGPGRSIDAKTTLEF